MAKFVENPAFRRQFEDRFVAPIVEKATDKLSSQFDMTMNSNIFYWDRATRRTNGEIARSPRNVKDTGKLINSKVVNRISRKRWEIAWLAEYAVFVLLGGVSRADGTETPGMNWIEKTLE
jgi:hypothetical protein